LGFRVENKRVLVLGAGGAARGVLGPLLALHPALFTLVNRTLEKARLLKNTFSALGAITVCDYAGLEGPFDLVINATSSSLKGEGLDLPDDLFAADSLAYDLMYGNSSIPFQELARRRGAGSCADGVGMLVEQAAESFYLWRAVRPATRDVIATLKRAC
ncbi:MAG: shikimate dehydrogenase, partial [Burkholderiales bacterium]